MFEYGNESSDTNSIVIYCGAGVLALIWIIYPLPLVGFVIEAYFLTCVIFVTNPFEFRKQDLKKAWFWRTMLGAGAVIHLPVLVGLWFLDTTYPALLSGILPMFLVTVIILVPEIVIFDQIVRRFKPDETDDTTVSSR
jgi:hypothetical protein